MSEVNEQNILMIEGRAENEMRRQEQILELYDKAITSNVDWNELKPKEQRASWIEWLGLSSCGDSQVEVKELPNTMERNTDFWSNYDIERSLAPELLKPEHYRAAEIIVDAMRVALAKTKVKRKLYERIQYIKQRETVKIQTCLRMYYARQMRIDAEEKRQYIEKDSKMYDKFLTSLLEGVQMLRWSHKKKALVPCILRVDDQNYEYFVFQQNPVRVKRYYFHDISTVTKGYQSPFLKQYVLPTDPDRTLSLYFRDRRKGGKQTSVDVVFLGSQGLSTRGKKKSKFASAPPKTTLSSSDKGSGDQDHKARMDRNRFFNNIKRLISELESDDAFFFHPGGAYCRVGRSIFERWERVTMIDPDWDPVDTQQLLLDHRAKQALQAAETNSRRKGMYRPWPLSEKHKPQNANPLRIAYRWDRTHRKDNRTRQYAACWCSETIEIDYGDYANVLETSQKWFKNPMRKEVFTLQRFKLVNSLGDDVVAEESLAPKLLPPNMHWKPEFIHKSKHTVQNSTAKKNGSASSRAAKVRLLEMKPYYEKIVKKLWGSIGITGWRNCVTGEFDFEDEDWRKLIAMARNKVLMDGSSDTAAVRAADELEVAMNNYEDMPVAHSPTDKKTEETPEMIQQRRQKKASSYNALILCRITVLRRLWSQEGVPSEDIQKKGRMWLVGGKSYNTAQKSAANKSIKPSSSKPEASAHLEIENAIDHAGHHARRGGATSIGGPRLLSGYKIELRILDLNKKKPYRLPLGLRVVPFKDPAEGFCIKSRKRDIDIIASVGLRVIDTSENVTTSIDSAWQMSTIAKNDVLVAVNGHAASTVQELIKLTQPARAPRILTFYRFDDISDLTGEYTINDEDKGFSSSEEDSPKITLDQSEDVIEI